MSVETLEDLPQDEIGETLQGPEEVDENAHLAPTWKNPIPASKDDPSETEEDRLLYYKERECCILLLEARRILAFMIALQEERDRKAWEEKRRLDEERKKKLGLLSCQEIQELLQSQPDDDMGDWINRIQELKRQMAIQIRKNYLYDRDVSMLDKKISLLIKNKSNIQDLRLKSKRRKNVTNDNVFASDPRKLEYYQNFFYLLQTEPRYLAKCVYLVNAEQMDTFLETTILTLYGDAYTPREEFLILKLFQLAIQHEMSTVKNLSDFLGGDSVVPKMVITYNRRKLGLEYLRKTLKPMLETLIEKQDINLDLNPISIYQQMIFDEECQTGQKSQLERRVTEEQALQHEKVKQMLDARIKELSTICQQFLDGILRSLDDLPYGMRWICKQLRDLAQKALPEASKDDILKLQVYFVYYRFINLAIVTPDAYNIVESEIPPVARKNLVFIAKVLQNVFNFREFAGTDRHMMPLNEFINKSKPSLIRYIDDLPRVEDPEDFLQVNRYMELTHQTKPVISISLPEMYNTHKLVAQHLDQLAPEKEDPLRQILIDLGPPPETINEEDDRDIQLTLTNRFKVEVEEESEIHKLYAETKELVIPILRLVPIQNTIQRLNLMDILEYGIKHATENNNRDLSAKINQVLENLGKLEKEELVTKEDNYESFIHDVALEVANRSAIREQQRKEIVRLTNTLENLTKYEGFVTEKIENYKSYVDSAIKAQFDPKAAKKSFKFSYKDLQKKNVILDSEVPSLSRGKTVFTISNSQAGIYEVKAKIAGVKVETMELKLDDLLERQFNGVDRLELDQITLDVNMTILLLNEKFRGKRR